MELQHELDSLNIDAKVLGITTGPSVDRYEVTLGPGVTANKIYRLEKHLNYVYGKPIRMSATAPKTLGIEVPHDGILVQLKDIIAPGPKTLTLGQSLDGPVHVDLDDLPHLLVAGSTGSGKSVFINSVICELIKKNTPDQLEMVLIDPKRVELAGYRGIPHLREDIVNDPMEADQALSYLVAEMQRRYDQMEQAGVRHARSLDLPTIVVVIDELADLMMVSSKTVEASIVRLSQLARAAGIHLLVATQRPSVDVITGLIKANIPGRLAFKTASAVDSRVILGIKGAEALTGRGDGLYLEKGMLTRLRSPFVSDNEIKRLVDYWI